MSVTISLSVAQDGTPVHVIDRKSGRTVWKSTYNRPDHPEAPLRAVSDDDGVAFGSITVVGPDGSLIGGIEERIVRDGDRVAFRDGGRAVTVQKGGRDAPPAQAKAGRNRRGAR